MHKNNIVHRDIKPENILIANKKSLEIKLTDFGFATYHNQKDLKDVLGSPMYMAPEIVKRQKYDNKVDCWSIGVVTFVLLTGSTPFDGKTKDEIYRSIKDQKPNFNCDELFVVSDNAKDFMRKMFGAKKPEDRLSAADALQHDWLSDLNSDNQSVCLKNVRKNLMQFCKMSTFQKMIFSLLSSLKIQQEELQNLR